MTRIQNQIQRIACCLICVAVGISVGCSKKTVNNGVEPVENTTELPRTAVAGSSGELYCKIAVGPNREKISLLKVDLENMQMQFDLNSDGILDEAKEIYPLVEKSEVAGTRYFESFVADEIAQGDDVHTGLTVKLAMKDSKVKAQINMSLWGTENSNTDANLIPLKLSAESEKAPVVHFNGPLTMGRYRNETKLKIGEATDFYSYVGTKGDGEGTSTAIENTNIPEGVSPIAVFSFPNKDSSQPAIEVRSELTVRC
ncbi:MAG: hypothetical protein AB8B55_21805 [Mariniblastus sp.]